MKDSEKTDLKIKLRDQIEGMVAEPYTPIRLMYFLTRVIGDVLHNVNPTQETADVIQSEDITKTVPELQANHFSDVFSYLAVSNMANNYIEEIEEMVDALTDYNTSDVYLKLSEAEAKIGEWKAAVLHD